MNKKNKARKKEQKTKLTKKCIDADKITKNIYEKQLRDNLFSGDRFIRFYTVF